MACNSEFVQYVIDQCSGAGEVAVRKMIGDYCIYCDGIIFGLICDNNLFIKVTEPGRKLLKEVSCALHMKEQKTTSISVMSMTKII